MSTPPPEGNAAEAGAEEASAVAARPGPARRHPKLKWIVGTTVVAAAVTALAFVLVLHSFNADAKRAAREFPFGNINANPTVKNNFEIDSNVVGVDTDKNLITLRISFAYQNNSDYTNSDGVLLGSASPTAPPAMTLVVVSDTGTQVVAFHGGEVLPVTDVSVNLNGRVTNYPFDTYHATVNMFLVAPDGTTQIPTIDFLNPGVHGFSIDTAATHLPGDTATSVAVTVNRASSSLFFSIFIMVLLWALAIAAVAIALVVVLLRRPIGAGILGFLAVLLFAFPQMRDALPGVPGVGAKVDYLAFFWAETLVAFTLVVLATIWIVRAVKNTEDVPFVDVG